MHEQNTCKILTLLACSEFRTEERRELMRESSEATRWRSASSSRDVRLISAAAESCKSFACSTSLETSSPKSWFSGTSPIVEPINSSEFSLILFEFTIESNNFIVIELNVFWTINWVIWENVKTGGVGENPENGDKHVYVHVWSHFL